MRPCDDLSVLACSNALKRRASDASTCQNERHVSFLQSKEYRIWSLASHASLSIRIGIIKRYLPCCRLASLGLELVSIFLLFIRALRMELVRFLAM